MENEASARIDREDLNPGKRRIVKGKGNPRALALIEEAVQRGLLVAEGVDSLRNNFGITDSELAVLFRYLVGYPGERGTLTDTDSIAVPDTRQAIIAKELNISDAAVRNYISSIRSVRFQCYYTLSFNTLACKISMLLYIIFQYSSFKTLQNQLNFD